MNSMAGRSVRRILALLLAVACLAIGVSGITAGASAENLPQKVRLVGIEVTQGVQDWMNSVTLVQGRKTAVRVFVEAFDSETSGKITGHLDIEDGEGRLLKRLSPINPDGSIQLLSSVAEHRGEFNSSLNFVIPHSLTLNENEDELTRNFRVSISESEIDCQDSVYAGNSCQAEVIFHKIARPNVYIMRVPVVEDGNYVLPSIERSIEQWHRIKDINPLPDITPKIVTVQKELDNAFPLDVDLSSVLSELEKYRSKSELLDENGEVITLDGDILVLGILNGSSTNPSGVIGIAEFDGHYGTSFTSRAPDKFDFEITRNAGAHEFGHLLGSLHLKHPEEVPLCGTRYPEEGDSPDYPYFQELEGDLVPAIGPISPSASAPTRDMNSEIWGLDVRFAALASQDDSLSESIVINPYVVLTIAGPCQISSPPAQNTWMDKYHHEKFINNINSRFGDKILKADSTAEKVPVDYFSGHITFNESVFPEKAEFVSLFSTMGVKSEGSFDTKTVSVEGLDAQGNPETLYYDRLAIDLRDSSGNSVRKAYFDISNPVIDEGAEATPLKFSFDVPVYDPPEYESFAVTIGGREIWDPYPEYDFSKLTTEDAVVEGRELASAVLSPNAPTIEIISPLRPDHAFEGDNIDVTWRGSDSDGDDLTYELYYSVDGGDTFRLVLSDTAVTSFSLNRDDWPGSDEARFRVSISDGTRSTFQDSVVFSVPENRPQVWIDDPLDNDVFTSNQGIVLSATGYDNEDGILPFSAYRWESNIDGDLGIGEFIVLSAGDLSTGSHRIKVTATDSSRAIASRTVNITVREAG